MPDKNFENDERISQFKKKSEFSIKHTNSEKVSKLLKNKPIVEDKIKKKTMYYKNKESDCFTPIKERKKLIKRETDYTEKTIENKQIDYSNVK